jgi:carboxymethylenebutenolidase
MKKYIISFIFLVIFILGYLYFNQIKNPEAIKENSKFMNDLTSAKYEISSNNVNYFEDRNGFYAEPIKPGNYPGIIMIHEWWGLNDHIKDSAKILSAQGYRVLAVDLFGKATDNPIEAAIQTKSLNQEKAIENMKSAKKFLSEKGSQKIGSLGWCFGGAQSLQIAVNENLDATVIYYGNLIEDKEKLKKINSPVLGIFGSTDAQIPVDKVNNFSTNLKDLNIQNDIKIYEGVGHAFANPTGQNFAPNETKDAWLKTLEFLSNNLN